ncbi:hypothetical protein C8Q80DRAFT_1107223 [Daedaleopsis nitida]|nr:hypothetical protein C8Q80DRAFT_1107223 [Daedaleopsis nitida]
MTTRLDILGGLHEGEIFWRDRYDWLEQRGYTLRVRYKPDWVPSWKGTKKMNLEVEDGLGQMVDQVMDAVRQSEGDVVVLKRVSKTVHPDEALIGQYLSSPPLSDDPQNHCCPILDVLDDPLDAEIHILVMPLLRPYDKPAMDTVGEAVAFFRQAFEGLLFMHKHHVAHRDCMNLNIMMDPHPMYPELYHFIMIDERRDYRGTAAHYSRTRRPCKYYWTDFGLSRRYDPAETNPLEYPILGGDRTVPEFLEDEHIPRNPFHTDVYYLGNLIREDFIQAYSNLTFMHLLVVSMVKKEPDQRPTMEDAVHELDNVLSKLPWWKLRARLRRRRDDGVINFLKDVQHIFRTAFYILMFRPAVPIPSSTPKESDGQRAGTSKGFGALARYLPFRKQSSHPSSR